VSAFAMNVVCLMGNMTRDPELKTLPSGLSVCDFGIAVNEQVKDRETDQWIDRPVFVNCSMFGKLGEWLAGNSQKGTQVVVQGKLRFRQWEAQDGSRRSALDVIADKAVPVERRKSSGGSAPPVLPTARPDAPGGPWDPGSGSGPVDEDIPFAFADPWAGIDGPLR
jgi:single-strand DNA-binding protein